MDQVKGKILLIEDNPADIRLIKETLKEVDSFNYEFIAAQSIKEGLERIKSDNFALILLDLNLPDSIGKQTFDTIMSQVSGIPIVLVSGIMDENLSLSLVQKGAQDYILKLDLNKNILIKTINFAIERKKLLNELYKKTRDLELTMEYFYGREQKMIELKREVNELSIKLGGEKRYL